LNRKDAKHAEKTFFLSNRVTAIIQRSEVRNRKLSDLSLLFYTFWLSGSLRSDKIFDPSDTDILFYYILLVYLNLYYEFQVLKDLLERCRTKLR